MEHFLGEYETGAKQFQVYKDSYVDYVRVFYDDVTDTIKAYYWNILAYDNGAEGTLLSFVTAYNTEAIDSSRFASHQYCEGRTLVRFRESKVFPWFAKDYTENHFSCAQSICDLTFKTPKITPSHVEVVATSSYLPVEYSLEENFVFGYGKPFGNFDLLPGIWTIYAKDGAGCSAQITVQVPLVIGYSLRFKGEYDNIKGETTRIEIHEKQYQGAVTDVGCLTSEPLVINWGKSGDERTEPIKGSEANVGLISFSDYNFIDLFTSDSRRYRLDVIKDEVLFWRGWVLPELYNEPYLPAPYPVSCTATDGIGDLKNFLFYLVDPIFGSASKYSGRMSHISLIAICLNKIGLDLPIYTAVNVFEENMEYMDAKGINLMTLSPVGNQVYPTTLQANTLYNFEIEGNLNVQVFYNDVLLNAESTSSYGFYNSDFENGLEGWNSYVWRESSPWQAIGNAVSTGGSQGNSELLFQYYEYNPGQEYTFQIKLSRFGHSPMPPNISLSRIEVYAGNTPPPGTVFADPIYYKDTIFTSNWSANDETITFSFTPNETQVNFYMFVDFLGDTGKSVVIDHIRILGLNQVSTFSYTPIESNGTITINYLSGSGATLKVFEAVKDPINQIYVNVDNYYNEEGSKSCYDILIEQLKPYGARIYQANGAWHIVKFDQSNRAYQRNRYTKDGEYEYSEIYDPVIDIKVPSLTDRQIWVNEDMILEISPGYQYLSVDQSLGYVKNLITNGEFPPEENGQSFTYGSESGDPKTFTFTLIGEEDGVRDYALDFQGKFSSGWMFAIRKIKALITASTPKSGLPPGGELQDGDTVLIGNNNDPAGNGLFTVKKDGAWVKQNSDGEYYLPSYGSVNKDNYLFYVSTNGANKYIYSAPLNSINKVYRDTNFVRSKAKYLQYASGDKIAFLINKRVDYNSDFDINIKLRVEIQVGNLYLSDDYIFTEKYNFLEFNLSKDKAFTDIKFEGRFTTEGGGEFTMKVSPMLYSFIVDIGGGGGGSWGNVNLNFGPNFSPVPNLLIDLLEAVYLPGGLAPSVVKSQRLNNSQRFSFVPEDLEMMHGDIPEVLNNTLIHTQYLSHADGTPTAKWHRKNYNESKNLLKLLLESVIANNLKSNYLISGTIREYLTINSVVFDPQADDRVFMINRITFNDYKIQSSVELAELTMNEDLSNAIDAAFSVGFSIGFKS